MHEPPYFCALIQDIFPNFIDNHYYPDQAFEDKHYVLCYQQGAFMLRTSASGRLELPQKSDFIGYSSARFLFQFNGTPCFLLTEGVPSTQAALSLQAIASYRTLKPIELAWVGLVGSHLLNWYAHNRFCGKCGAEMAHKSDERAMQCPTCGNIVYPRISPAVIVAITSGDSILLATNSSIPERRYSLIAGFVEVGETLEEAVKREVKEEVGLDVRNIRYSNSQPWPLTGSLMIGFTAESDLDQSIEIDTNELLEAQWFKRGALPNHSLSLSIAGTLIDRFEQGSL